MGKLKTNKSVRGRIKITKSGKLLRLPSGHGHFRGKKSGKFRRRVRKYVEVSKADEKAIKKYLPYNRK